MIGFPLVAFYIILNENRKLRLMGLASHRFIDIGSSGHRAIYDWRFAIQCLGHRTICLVNRHLPLATAFIFIHIAG
jgi:hypothetical protein